MCALEHRNKLLDDRLKETFGMVRMNNPSQGDHIFGNVLDVLHNALKDKIIGGDCHWEEKLFNSVVYGPEDMNKINEVKTNDWRSVASLWQKLKSLDLGHSNRMYVVDRNTEEKDNHSKEFGKYAGYLRWDFCQVRIWSNGGMDCIGWCHSQDRDRFGKLVEWGRTTMASFDGTMEHLVDETALARYLSGKTLKPGETEHKAISLEAAKTRAEKAKYLKGPKIIERCKDFQSARSMFERMLKIMSNMNIYWNQKDKKWISIM